MDWYQKRDKMLHRNTYRPNEATTRLSCSTTARHTSCLCVCKCAGVRQLSAGGCITECACHKLACFLTCHRGPSYYRLVSNWAMEFVHQRGVSVISSVIYHTQTHTHTHTDTHTYTDTRTHRLTHAAGRLLYTSFRLRRHIYTRLVSGWRDFRSSHGQKGEPVTQ